MDTYITAVTKGIEHMQNLGQSGVDWTMQMFNEWNKSWQALTSELGDYSKHSFGEGVATVEKLITSKSVEQAIKIQMTYAKRAYEEYMQLGSKIGDMYAEMAQKAFRTIEERPLSESAINSSNGAIRVNGL